jgi:hypothetical protein
MKATIEIKEGEFSIEIISKKTRYQSKGTIVLDEDAKEMREDVELLALRIIRKSDNYTQSKATINK